MSVLPTQVARHTRPEVTHRVTALAIPLGRLHRVLPEQQRSLTALACKVVMRPTQAIHPAPIRRL